MLRALRKTPARLFLPLLLLVVFLLGWRLGLPEKTKSTVDNNADTIWTCSMHPQIRQPEPGLCPICNMDLITLESGSETTLREIKVTQEAAALMDLRVSPVVRQATAVDVRLFGKIAYDERHVNTTTARIGGRLDRFYVDYTGTLVRKGDHIAEIYSPDLFVAQQDLINAAQGLARARNTGTSAAVRTQERLLHTARERLRLLQLTDRQIDAIQHRSKPADHITLFAPQNGVVTKRHVKEGAYVKTGDPLFAVAGLETVWLNLEAYESDLPWLHFAQDVRFTVEAVPGKVFHGRIADIDEELDNNRRVVSVRVNVDNSQRSLKPGMFARATVHAQLAADNRVIDPDLAGKWISPMHPEIVKNEPGQCDICGMDLVPAEQLGFTAPDESDHVNPLLVPASAVLGTRQNPVVYVRTAAAPEPTFEGREITVGHRVGEQHIVESGLREGELVVTRGAFKLDSELQIRARPSLMNRNAGLKEIPAAEAEASLLGQWGPIPRLLGRLIHAARQKDATAMRAVLEEMQAARESIDTSSFQPRTVALWREFSARLDKAITSAHKAAEQAPETALREVSRTLEECGRYLGLPYHPKETAINPARLALLQTAIRAYLPVSEALALDNAAAATAHRESLVRAMNQLGANDAAEAFAAAEGLDSLRQAFEPISAYLIVVIRTDGLDQLGNVYVVHCPMAFDSKGGDWLSNRPEVRNPYFGSGMFSCGTVVENLSFDPDGLPPKGEGERTHSRDDHNH